MPSHLSDFERIGRRKQTNCHKNATNELPKLSEWFAHNKLTLNYKKTEYIDFGKSNRNSPQSNLSLKIDGMEINRVEESKFLGVILDQGILWRSHINKVLTKISQTIGIISRARNFMDSSQLVLLYNTMVLPHLQYCLINWGNFKDDRNLKLRDRLLVMQKRFVRIICGAPRMSHADPLFAKLSVLKIDDLFEQAVRVFAFKLSKSVLPNIMASLFRKPSHSYATRGYENSLYANRSHHRSIKSIVPRHWNRLNMALKQSPSIDSFKSNSKKELLTPYLTFTCHTKNCHSCQLTPPAPN